MFFVYKGVSDKSLDSHKVINGTGVYSYRYPIVRQNISEVETIIREFDKKKKDMARQY